MSQDGYAARSHKFLAQASDELAQGDSVQASEKLWGAAAQMLKAVAARRGWPHNSHRRLFEAAARLAEESGDDELSALFREASGLHTNFYEDWMPASMVQSAIPAIERLVSKLEAL
jgi:hypothetical protein